MRLTRIRRLVVLAALGGAGSAAAQVSPAQTDSLRRGSGRDSSVTPTADQARGVDAEVRVALFELASGRPLAALIRLEWLRSSPVALTGAGGGGALLAREELLFLLAQAYYRLGMTDAFRSTAEQLTAGAAGGRFAGVLRLQLLVNAYRRGEYARAIAMAGDAPAGDRGLASLIVGLANYSTRNFGAARAAFDAAGQSGGAYAGYARYMSALAAMAGDTTQSAATLEALQSLGGQVPGEFSDQVKLTAAQLAYHRGQYDAAASLAANVSEGGLAAGALLTRAWALYKANQLDGAGAAFRDFAARYPQLPQRDEARVMVGQVMLQTGRTDEAGQHFRTIADSIASEVATLQARTSAAMTDAARALVAARATGLLFLNAPIEGKTIAVPDEELAMSLSALAAVLGGSASPGADSAAPELVSVTDVEARLGALSAPLGAGLSHRLVYVTAAGGTQPAAYVQRAQALRQADVAVALARYRLQELLDAHAAKIALLQRLQQMLGEEGGRLTEAGTRLAAVRDSLARVSATVDATRARLRDLLRGEAEAVRQLAAENEARADSLRRAAMGPMTPEDQNIVGIETSTAGIYRQLAEAAAGGIDAALARHPAVRLRDSLRVRWERVQALLAETQGLVAATGQLVGEEVARLQRTGSERAATARSALAAAEGRRGTAEAQLVSAVEAELRARANRLVAILRHDNEAAEFGAASAAFFKAVDAERAAGAGGSGGGANGTGAAPGGTAGGTREGGARAPSQPPAAAPPPSGGQAGGTPSGKPTTPR